MGSSFNKISCYENDNDLFYVELTLINVARVK
ncbi:Uncharacterised protein [Legionella sainthelensi]|nr:Uncharacterised protein [Legionella sainthelensi]